MQDAVSVSNDKHWNSKWKNATKYIIWLAWLGFIVYLYVKNSPLTPDAMYKFDIDPQYLIVYIAVVIIVYFFTLLTGKRGMCHSFCWMAPFMIAGENWRICCTSPAFG